MIAILTGMRCNFNMVLNFFCFFFLMAKDAELFCMLTGHLYFISILKRGGSLRQASACIWGAHACTCMRSWFSPSFIWGPGDQTRGLSLAVNTFNG